MNQHDMKTTTKGVVYSDIFINLNMHPGNNQLARYTNENAVKRSIKTLVLTDQNERLYQPSIRCEVRKALFEPVDDITSNTIKSLITETIENHEPRANLLDVIVKPDVINQMYNVRIIFSMINIPDPVTMTIKLNRVR